LDTNNTATLYFLKEEEEEVEEAVAVEAAVQV
jgi:hypothetical protein